MPYAIYSDDEIRFIMLAYTAGYDEDDETVYSAA